MMSVNDAIQESLWINTLADRIDPRAVLRSNLQADVAIIGGGFSGLWTAYYLQQLDPNLDIAIIEKHHCGYGASGRNGGWCIGELAGSFDRYAKMSSRGEAMRLERAVMDAVDEVGLVVDSDGIDCGFAKGGAIFVARNKPQEERQKAHVRHMHQIGYTESDIRLLSADEASKHVNASNVRSGVFFAPAAALNPARLVRGLAELLVDRGVSIYEQTAATGIVPGEVSTTNGVVTASSVIRATEAYTRDLQGEKRTLLPVYSLMIATEPLDTSVFDEIGLADRQTFADDRHMVIYGQRTDDNRLAFGGRGVPYLFGSKIEASAELHTPSHELLRETLVDLFPILDDAVVSHRWGGVLGIPRDWVPGLRYDKTTGLGTLGGYVGEGVAAANLAGRTMAELVVGTDTERTSLPWVGVQARRWEPEPLRWLGVRASRRMLAAADDREYRTDEEASIAYKVSRLLRGA